MTRREVLSEMAYDKPWVSCEDQLTVLMRRGLQVTDHARALEYLRRIGYYRLSGYWFPFRERSGLVVLLDGRGGKTSAQKKATTIALDSFQPGSTFEQAVQLYVFDKKLRLLAMDALERIEVAVRADIAHLLGKIDPFAYLKPELFQDSFGRDLRNCKGVTEHHDWIGKHARLIGKSKEEFIRHNKEKYGLPLAIWVACEVWDFGTMSKLYEGMRENEQRRISLRYGLQSGRVFASWLRSLNYLRNVCAHHSRLWNRNVVDQPKLPDSEAMPWVECFEGDSHLRARCFLLFCIARHFLCIVNPSSTWAGRVDAHLRTLPSLDHVGLGMRAMGAPEEWSQLWSQIAVQ